MNRLVEYACHSSYKVSRGANPATPSAVEHTAAEKMVMLLRMLTDDYRAEFEDQFSCADQATSINALRDLICLVLYGPVEEWRKLGLLLPDEPVPEDMDFARLHLSDVCYWQLSLFYRYSAPTRIAEAEPFLRQLLRNFASVNDADKRDVLPMLYLASALQKKPGNDEEALALFREAFAYYEGPKQMQMYGVKSELWARANYSRLLRKMGEDIDAREQEKGIREYIVRNITTYPPSLFRKVVTDPTEPGSMRYTIDHPDVKRMLERVTELRFQPTRVEEGSSGAVPKMHDLSHPDASRTTRAITKNAVRFHTF